MHSVFYADLTFSDLFANFIFSPDKKDQKPSYLINFIHQLGGLSSKAVAIGILRLHRCVNDSEKTLKDYPKNSRGFWKGFSRSTWTHWNKRRLYSSI